MSSFALTVTIVMLVVFGIVAYLVIYASSKRPDAKRRHMDSDDESESDETHSEKKPGVLVRASKRVSNSLASPLGKTLGICLILLVFVFTARADMWQYVPGGTPKWVEALRIAIALSSVSILWILILWLIASLLFTLFKVSGKWLGPTAMLAIIAVILLSFPWSTFNIPETGLGRRSGAANVSSRPDAVSGVRSGCTLTTSRNNTCEVQSDSGWIYAEDGTKGDAACWNPQSHLGDPEVTPEDRPFLRIEYLDAQSELHDFVPGKPMGTVRALRFIVNPAYINKRGLTKLTIEPFAYPGEACPAD